MASSNRELPALSADFGFLWRIDRIVPEYNNTHRQRIVRPGGSEMANDTIEFWLPPNTKHGVRKTKTGTIYRWRPNGSVESHEDPQGLDRFRYCKASVFVQAGHENFLAVDFDCTQHDVNDSRDGRRGWSNITFNHLGRYLSEVDFSGGQSRLAAPAHSSSWMPQVVPYCYSPPIYGPSKQNKPGAGEGGLCGRLSLLIAMAACSVLEESAELAVCQGFRNGKWIPHRVPAGIGRYQDRGVVVSIWEDPESSSSRDEIRAWEEGHFGPIWAAYPTNSTPSTTSFNASSSYSPTEGHSNGTASRSYTTQTYTSAGGPSYDNSDNETTRRSSRRYNEPRSSRRYSFYRDRDWESDAEYGGSDEDGEDDYIFARERHGARRGYGAFARSESFDRDMERVREEGTYRRKHY